MDIQSADQLRSMFTGVQTIAVVEDASKPSTPATRDTPFYLQMLGYRILCISPAGGEMPGQPWYRSSNDVDGPVDVVDAFSTPGEAEDVVLDTIAIAAWVLWFEPGADSAQAVHLAEDYGLEVVTGRSFGATFAAWKRSEQASQRS